jgi:hypothetical protein
MFTTMIVFALSVEMAIVFEFAVTRDFVGEHK